VLRPGTLLRERYCLTERIASGSMGAVYRATDQHADRTVAIKQLIGDAAPLRAAFEREAHLLSQLSHPALPRVEDVFSDDAGQFLVMTFVPGADLGDQLARRGEPFPGPTVLAWADVLLDVLTYLHTRQLPVIHRDIKPRNLKLDADGRIVLLDFGLARGGGGSTQATLAGYTLQYAPLEQVRGDAIEPRSDLYALAATLYVLLTRRPLADAPQRAAALADGQPDPLAVVENLQSTAGRAVASVLAQALALDPRHRPATARVMQVALRNASAGLATTVVPPDSPGAGRSTPQPPSGTVTFLATELTDGAPSPAALARHDTQLRHAIDAHGGFVFRSSLRGFSAAFDTSTAALDAALAAQRGLGPLRLRMALLTGTAQFSNQEYVSAALPRLPRLLAVAHPGQILLVRTTHDLLAGETLPGVALRDLGEHRLPDVADAEHVYQVVVFDLPAEFAPLISHELRGPRLPAAGTLLVGRTTELTAVVEHVRQPSVRLLTLTGPGGVGKTRLAVRAAEALLDDFPGGVYFVPLAAVRRSSVVLDTISRAVGVRETPGQLMLDNLQSALRRAGAVLLVLDNFEHVLPAGSVVRELLTAAPQLKVLVTSRVRLELEGERLFSVPPLPFATPTAPPSSAELTKYPAIELFMQRARAAAPELVLDAETAQPIAALCARLDGLPLAIELAAARTDLFSPSALLDRIAQRAPLLTGGLAGRLPHQQTLRATLAWSYDLLEPAERRLFAQLGVFAGAFLAEAADAMCSLPDDSGRGVATGLNTLLASSLLRAIDQPDGGVRYEMLETVREYASERLAATSDSDAVRRRHAEYYLSLAETADAELVGPRMQAWLATLTLEHNNLRAALDWLSRAPDAELGLRLCAALWRFWQVQSHMTEGRDWLERLLARPSTNPGRGRARALVGAGALAWRQQDLAHAERRLREAVEACRSVDEPAGLASALKHLGLVALYSQPPRYAEAERLVAESLTLRRALNDRDGVASCLNDLAVIALQQRHFLRAQPWLEESEVVCRELGNRYALVFVLFNQSLVALAREDHERAAVVLREGLTLARELEASEPVACALSGLACVAAVRATPETAARLYGASMALRSTIDIGVSEFERETYDRYLERARARLDPTAWEAATAEGRALPLDTVIEDVLRNPVS
jgi:predicted ATPase